MTTQPENKDKSEQRVSKDELSEKELEKTTGGLSISKLVDKATPKG